MQDLNINFSDFWDEEDDYYENENIVTEELILKTESLLGYKLPKSYIETIKSKNGGTPLRTCFPTTIPTSWADDHVAISGIIGIGENRSIEIETQSMIADWGYPNVGIIVCDCPSGGHDAIMLDYSICVVDGEPQVIHVDVEISDEPVITFLADKFESFLLGLVSESEFDI